MTQATIAPSSIEPAHANSNLATVHGDMLLGLIFTPRLYKHIPWSTFHVPVVKLEPPRSPLGNVYTFRIDWHTAEMTDICGAFKSFLGAKKYIKVSLADRKFLVVKLQQGAIGLSILQHILVPHLKARYPEWNVELDTEALYGNGKHKPIFN